MKKINRIIALVCALLMIFVVFTACGNNGDDPEETTNPGAVGTDTQPADTEEDLYDSDGYRKDNLPDDLDYGDQTVRVLYWQDVERPEFVVEEGITGDNVGDAIIERNNRIEERLGVKLEFIGENGDNGDRANFVKAVETTYNAGLREWDIVATYSRTAGMLAIQGYLADLNSIEDSYIDTSMPWWPASIVDTMGVGDALYYVSGDASTNTLHFMYTIYYNTQLLEDRGLTDPTEYVLNKTWTLDKLIEMTTGVYQDLDNDSKASVSDFYGFTSIYYNCDAFYTGSNLKLVERTDDDDLLKISDDYFSEKAINLVDKLGQWLTTNDCYISRSGASVSYQDPFVNGTALFCQNRVYMADNKHKSGLNSVTWSYGLVPTPLYDENQEEYVTVVGNPFTLYGIMTDVPESDRSMLTAVLECWGSEAYRLTTPALFETNMKYKYTQEDVYSQMFDILRETSSFDQGRIYSNDLGPYISELPSKAMTDGASWATLMKTYQKLLGKQLDLIIESFQKIQNN